MVAAAVEGEVKGDENPEPAAGAMPQMALNPIGAPSIPVNASEELAAGWCAHESHRCDSWRPCCGDLKCEHLLGGSGKVCLREQPQCVQEHGECGGPGRQTLTCCGGGTCEQLLGGSVMHCRKPEPQCVQDGGECGGPGRQTLTCCGGGTCERLLGGSVMHCQKPQPQCVQDGGECGGPGRQTLTCCGG